MQVSEKFDFFIMVSNDILHQDLVVHFRNMETVIFVLKCLTCVGQVYMPFGILQNLRTMDLTKTHCSFQKAFSRAAYVAGIINGTCEVPLISYLKFCVISNLKFFIACIILNQFIYLKIADFLKQKSTMCTQSGIAQLSDYISPLFCKLNMSYLGKLNFLSTFSQYGTNTVSANTGDGKCLKINLL